jgi:hypothetical protein
MNTPNVDSLFAPVAPLASNIAEALGWINRTNTPLALAIQEVMLAEVTASLLGRFPKVVLLPKVEVVTVPTQNATSRWLALHFKEVNETLSSHLRTKLRRSVELSVVDDHIQTFLVRLIKDDRLALMLDKGEEINLAVLRHWVFQSAVTEIRRWGVWADLRTTRNARTSREVQKGTGFKPVQSASVAVEVSTKDFLEEEAKDLVDPTDKSPEDVASAKSRIAHVRATLARRGQAHLIPMVDGLLEGRSMEELQETYKVSGATLTKAFRKLNATA